MKKHNFGREAKMAYIFLIPAILFFSVFLFYPIFFALWISFTRWDLATKSVFVGLRNYFAIPLDPITKKVFTNTVYFTFVRILVGLPLGLGIALLLGLRPKFLGFWRSATYIPVITTWVIVGLIWNWLLHPQLGLVNYLLTFVGFEPQLFLSDYRLALTTVTGVSIWKGLGYWMIIFLAGLQSIPKQYYEAAQLDGATRWKQFTGITIPLLKPTILFLLATSIIASFQIFDAIYVMTQGGPGQATKVWIYEIYMQGFTYLRMGYACALSWVLMIFLAIVTVIQFRYLGGSTSY